MLFILVTLETSHLEISELKVFLLANTLSILVTIDVSHVLMSLPYGYVYVVPPVIQSVTALLILMLRSLPPQVKSSAVMPVLGNDV